MTESFLQTKLREYVSLRIALGIPLNGRELPLQNFVDYLQKQPKDAFLRAQSAIDWVCLKADSHSVMTQYVRLSLARGFLRHLKADLPELQIPDLRLIARPRRSVPYIFSNTDLNKLLGKAGSDRLPKDSMHPFTLQTIIGLMVCSGLRPGEIIRLNVTDILSDPEPPRLLISSSKFKKSRWVPLHFTAYNRLMDYLDWREQLKCDTVSESLFVCNKGKRLTYQRLRRRFAEVIQSIKLLPKPGQMRPTLH
jgi:integrase